MYKIFLFSAMMLLGSACKGETEREASAPNLQALRIAVDYRVPHAKTLEQFLQSLDSQESFAIHVHLTTNVERLVKNQDVDLVVVPDYTLKALNAQGLLYSFSRRRFLKDSFLSNILAQSTFNGLEYYGLPFAVDTSLLFYEEGESAPDAWSNVAKHFAWYNGKHENLSELMTEFLLVQGLSWRQASGALFIATETNIQMLSHVVQLVQDKSIRINPRSKEAFSRRLGSTYLEEKERNPNIRVGPFPKSLVSPNHNSLTHVFVAGITIASPQPRSEWAWQMMMWFTSYEAQVQMMLQTGLGSALIDPYEASSVLERIPHARYIRQSALLSYAFTKIYYEDMHHILGDAVEAAIAGSLSPKRALEQADERIKAVQKRYGR